jgi:RNA-dependent RNA polymerase
VYAQAVLTFREHAIWYIDSGTIDGLELREWMGNVAETIVAKHAARMGLVSSSILNDLEAELIVKPFSTSRIVDLNIHMGPKLQDVERNGYCFTDGVGVAGTEVMREAARALGYTRGINGTPSAIQFRLG